jgi:hypothetical protein
MKVSDKMLEQVNNGDLIITENKNKVLKYFSSKRKLINLKIMTKQEFVNHYFGKIKNEAIYYLMKKYQYCYDIAVTYLKNFLWIEELYHELKQNNLIEENPLFKKNIKRIVLLEQVDPFIQKEIEKYEHIEFLEEIRNNNPVIYELETLEEEVNYMFLTISNLLKQTTIQKIYIIDYNKEYQNMIRRYSFLYHIPINFNEGKDIYGLIEVQKFLKSLENNSLEEALKEITTKEILNIVIDICNQFSDCEDKNIFIEIIKQKIRQTKIYPKKKKNAINIASLEEIEKDNYYFLIGFNQGIMPLIYKDEDLLSDKEKKKKLIFTSDQKNKLEKMKIIKLIKNTDHLFISYKLKSYSEEYYPSPLIDELELQVCRPNIKNYSYSNLYNQLDLSKKLDSFIKFNEKNLDLNLLYHSYPTIPYLTYDNSYHSIANSDFQKYTNGKLLLSYSSLDHYNRCGFRYYISNLLKLNKYEETFMTLIGNLFHYILSIAFSDNFDFEREFEDYIKDKQLTNKEKFFINKLKEDLKYTIDIIKEQDKTTSLKNALYEQKIFVSQNHKIQVTFMGIIDKLKYCEENGQTIVAIIDYKTGTPDINLNNSIYGIEMQLPIYLYLAKNSKLKNVQIAGFYLQKIIHNKLPYQKENYESAKKKLYRLDGYSNDNIEILKQFDSNYSDSSMIKGMKLSSKGFYAYTKVLNQNQMNKLEQLTKEKIKETTDNILNLQFDINPKKIGQNLIGCEFCSFKDICYQREENIVYLKEQNYHDFLGGE